MLSIPSNQPQLTVASNQTFDKTLAKQVRDYAELLKDSETQIKQLCTQLKD